jgi:hypothetical protein
VGVVGDECQSAHHLVDNSLLLLFVLRIKKVFKIDLGIAEQLQTFAFVVKLGKLRVFNIIHIVVDVYSFLKHQPIICQMKTENKLLTS